MFVKVSRFFNGCGIFYCQQRVYQEHLLLQYHQKFIDRQNLRRSHHFLLWSTVITLAWWVLHKNSRLQSCQLHSRRGWWNFVVIQIGAVLTYLLTYSMEQNSSWEANWFSASQEIPRVSRNPKVHYRTHKLPPPVSILSQFDPVHTPHPISLISILILSSHLCLGLPSGLFPSVFPTKTLYTPILSLKVNIERDYKCHSLLLRMPTLPRHSLLPRC